LVASGRVELRANCIVEGDIRALRLAVEDNAVFRGKVDLTQGASNSPEIANAPVDGDQS
jgi:cytoskeletal protein CcmA (bactofilin family)